MIPKIIIPSSFRFNDINLSTLLDTYSKGLNTEALEKSAAVFDNRIKEIQPKKGHAYVHLITTGAKEFYGPNNNGDGFNEKEASFNIPKPKKDSPSTISLDGGLIKYHDKTFLENGAVYKNHVNRNKGGKPEGLIKFAAYNIDMHRGELITELPIDKWKEDVEKLAKEEPIYFSMGAAMARDICSYCGNIAKNRNEYCDHLKYDMLAMDKQGNQVYAINDQPIFHDISRVFRPADKIAFGLRKVANASSILSGADLADMYNYVPPVMNKNAANLLIKLAKIEKEIALQVKPNSDISNIISAFKEESGFGDIPPNTMFNMQQMDLEDLFSALREQGIILPIDKFYELIMKNNYPEIKEDVEEAKVELPNIFTQITDEENKDKFIADGSYTPKEKASSASKNIVEKIEASNSQKPEAVRMRIMRITLIPKKEVKTLEKKANRNQKAIFLAKEYAKYQLASLVEGADDYALKLTVAQNWANK